MLTLLNWNGVELVLLSTKESSQHVINQFTGIYVHFSLSVLSLAYSLSWVFSEYCILWNGHLYLTEQSFILAVAVMFSLHVYMYIYKLTYVHVYTGHTLLCYYRLVYLPMVRE